MRTPFHPLGLSARWPTLESDRLKCPPWRISLNTHKRKLPATSATRINKCNTEFERRLVLAAILWQYISFQERIRWVFTGSNQSPLPPQTTAVDPKYVLNRYLVAWACSQGPIRAATA
jgi:hypothetical protein